MQGQVVPVTPIRKLLCRLPSLRRKRSRRTSASRSVGEGDVRTTLTRNEFPPTLRQPLPNDIQGSTTPACTVPASHCSNGLKQSKRAQLAIQQYDHAHDAIVISTLPYYPFCCHQDLLAMTRPRLLQTAYLFNSCLPFSARFTDLEVSSDARVRRRIEELVGISSGARDDHSLIHPRDLISLTRRRSRNGMLSSHRCLDVLVEEDEGEFSSCRRASRSTMAGTQNRVSSRSWDYGERDLYL